MVSESVVGCIGLYLEKRGQIVPFGVQQLVTGAVPLKGSYDAISSFPFSLECYKLFVHRYDP